ncbi:MAG: hypothetical protein UW63_C0039G0001 [Candidatus Uhrbacteria bacterium GW2011_GWF2_44_350]|uniref:AtpZ/AtpI family protein n=2 Tax=Candidatus Uhriibacteriota TaxID=1752732 RepID=A0A0G1MDH2_9BACT|nr:MAG: hypothetical protein UW63_C0039G0001 [Candidatus Uhrbacteria bacterium GW2011_GWF2_44_350]HBR80724.1 hypothetical protein [Candidatus Uhrbacteria bacterium]HCU31984.1 hypothetical protein [Candidatus Uhrbacteria bacterium]
MEEPEVKPTKKTVSDAVYYRFAMHILGDFGVTIAVPAVVATFVGIWLDKKLETTPWFLILGLTAALIATYLVIKKKASIYAKQFEDIDK